MRIITPSPWTSLKDFSNMQKMRLRTRLNTCLNQPSGGDDLGVGNTLIYKVKIALILF